MKITQKLFNSKYSSMFPYQWRKRVFIFLLIVMLPAYAYSGTFLDPMSMARGAQMARDQEYIEQQRRYQLQMQQMELERRQQEAKQREMEMQYKQAMYEQYRRQEQLLNEKAAEELGSWKLIGSSKEKGLYLFIDENSIRKRGKYREANVLVNYVHNINGTVNVNALKVGSIKTLTRFYCNKNQFEEVSSETYSYLHATGSLMNKEIFKPSKIATPIPGTAGQTMFSLVCSSNKK